MRLSVIIPTVGRDTLLAAIESARDADEIVVVLDTAGAPGRLPLLPDWAHLTIGEVTDGDHGYGARTEGMRLATGTHLAFLDDDDVYLPDAIPLFRTFASGTPVIFKMDDPTHGILWREPFLRYANVGTPMILVPNDPDRLGVWEAHENGCGGDFTFLRGCVEKMGDPIWREELVAKVRPHQRGPSITVVTPWLNHPELVDDYMDAILVGNPDDLIVVDNASEPPLDLPGIRLDTNEGFSKACNIGLRAATTDAVLFLNNDIALTRSDWLQRIRAELEPGVLIGAQIRNEPHAHVDGEPLPYLDGWCIGGIRDDLNELGGFDESYDEPAYFSDNDLCLRARGQGMTLREVRVGLVHKLNMTAGHGPDVTRATAANYERYAERARNLIGAAV